MFIALTGKPSCGKSTFFKAATLMDVDIANYPFTTIKPNSGVGFVKIKSAAVEFGKIPNPREGYFKDGWRFVPVQMIDVAGLVPGAHEGKGLGNEFLNDLSQADALIHVVDVSGSLNEKGESVERGSYNPSSDIKFLEHELDMWYYQIFQRAWKKFANTINQTKENVVKAISNQFSGIKVTEDMVKEKMRKLNLTDKIIITWTEEDLKKLTQELRKETKPIIIAANKVDVAGAFENYERLKKEFPDYLIIPCSAESELALKEADKHGIINYVPGDNKFEILQPDKLNENQKNALEFIKKNLIEKTGSTGVQDVMNKVVFDLLKYIAVFPAGDKLADSNGNVLPDCFLMPPKTTALDFAYSLHSDLGNNFVRAVDIRTKKSLKKDSPLKHRDMIEILHSK